MDGLSDDSLRSQLIEHGISPGPIDSTTRKVYIKKLEKLISNSKSKDESNNEVVFRKPLPRRKAAPTFDSTSVKSSPSSTSGRRNLRSPSDVARFSSDESGTDEPSSSRVLRRTVNSHINSSEVASSSTPSKTNRGDINSHSPITSSRRTRQDSITPARPTRTSSRLSSPATPIPAAVNSRRSYRLAEDQLQVSDPDDDYRVNERDSNIYSRTNRRVSRKSFGANTSSFLMNSDSDESSMMISSSPLVDEEEDDTAPNGGLSSLPSSLSVPNARTKENGGFDISENRVSHGRLFHGIRWKRHVPNILLLVLIVLIGIVICAYMVQKDKHDMLRKSNEYNKILCQSDLLTMEESKEICLKPEELKKILTITRHLYNILSDHAGQYWCGVQHVVSPRMNVRMARQLVGQGSSVQGPLSPSEWNRVLTVVLRLPHLNVRVTTDEAGSIMADDAHQAVWLECMRPRLTVRCRVYYMTWRFMDIVRYTFESFIFYTTTLLCLLGVLISAFCIIFGVRWWIRNRNEVDMKRERAIMVVVDRLREVLKEQRSDSEMTQGIPSYLPIETLKDMCLTSKQRRDSQFWETVCDHIYEHESQVEIHEVPEVGEVWEWRKPASMQPAGWQGSALPDDNGQKLPFDRAPTECLKIRNMFSLESDRRLGWKERIQKELLSKCYSAGPILHIGIETGGTEGLVYVKCADRDVAGRAFQCIHANYFDGKLLTVKFLREEKYCRRYPEAAYSNIPLRADDF